MATIVANLNAASPGDQADNVTLDTNLTYRVYNDVDGYTSPEVFGSHVSDVDVSVAAGVVTITNVTDSGVSSFRISSVDEAGNESLKSNAFSTVKYTLSANRLTDKVWGVYSGTGHFDTVGDYIEIKYKVIDSSIRNALFGRADGSAEGNQSSNVYISSAAQTSHQMKAVSATIGTIGRVSFPNNTWTVARFTLTDTTPAAMEITSDVDGDVRVTAMADNVPLNLQEILRFEAAEISSMWFGGSIEYVDFNGKKFEFIHTGSVHQSVPAGETLTITREIGTLADSFTAI